MQERARRLDEQFRALERAAEERDTRYEQRFQAAQIALTAAMAAQEKAVQAALEAADRAVSKAEAATERRFESVNEFRGSLNDMASTLMSRAEASVAFGALTEKLATATSRLDKIEGTSHGVGISWGVLVGALGAIATVVALLALVAKGVV
jgi:hypothetical protein